MLRYNAEARAVLDDLLEKYAAHRMSQCTRPDVLKVPSISERDNVKDIIFGGAEELRGAVNEMQQLLHAA